MIAPPLAPHEGHAVLGLTGLLDPATRVGFLACMTCAQLIRPLRRCGRPTRDGGLCRVFVRDDLGHEALGRQVGASSLLHDGEGL